MFTIGKLAKRFGLSRSTLLYYDKLGLLCPSSHTKGDYCYYSQEDVERLERICSYKEAGISLQDIARILEQPGKAQQNVTAVLAGRLGEIDKEMAALKNQRKVLVSLLQGEFPVPLDDSIDKETWSDMLRSVGFSEEDMKRWHMDFESMAPEKHEQFLRVLGISEEEIASIRVLAK